MRRAALYARFSSDKQNLLSCRDQLALCAAWAERQGFAVVESFTDEAVSGASMVNRFGLAQLMRAARAKAFDVVICEAVDRLGRDQGDLSNIRRDLAFLGISIMTVQDGEVGAIHIGIKGLMGELYLADLAQKTRRGLSARIAAGASGGGRSYGYSPLPGRPGELVVNEREKPVVQRIFAEYVAGATPRRIAAALNAEGIAGPRGGKWNASAINGSRTRANGILQNRLYVGEIVWNRQRFLKDPATGKRVSRPNPESEWQVAAAPHLAIMERAVFDHAAAIKAGKRRYPPHQARRPRHLLSGKVRCGCCGASFTVIARDRLGCAGHRERGDCANGQRIGRAEVETRVLEALRTRLAEPELIAAYVREYHEERRRFAAEQRGTADAKRRRLADVTAQIERIVDRIVDGTAPAALEARCHELEAEQRQLRTDLADLDAAVEPVALHPGAAEQYRRIAADLQVHLAGRREGQPTDALLEKVRALIDRIDVMPAAETQKPADLVVHGRLSELLSMDSGRFSPEGIAGCGGRI